jgi:hypothetical protein
VRDLVTDYPLIEPPYHLPMGLECRGDDDMVILWDPIHQLHVDMPRASLTKAAWSVAEYQLSAAVKARSLT